jgi:hypothetical protein
VIKAGGRYPEKPDAVLCIVLARHEKVFSQTTDNDNPDTVSGDGPFVCPD